MTVQAVKTAAGYYRVGKEFVVERTADGWRWHSTDYTRGGEWRSTKREAMQDLDAFLTVFDFMKKGGR